MGVGGRFIVDGNIFENKKGKKGKQRKKVVATNSIESPCVYPIAVVSAYKQKSH